jgi:hypothetical protein
VCLLFSTSHAFAEDIVDYAARYIGRPYVWGAEGPSSFDCSGLMQYVHGRFGIDLPRRAIDQSRVGDRAGRLQRGDLLFFSTDPGESLVTHVGLYEGNGVMIDASKRHGRVRRDNLSDEFWEDRFLFARRVRPSLGGDEPIDAQNDPSEPAPRRSSDRRRATVRIIETIAGELLKIPARPRTSR